MVSERWHIFDGFVQVNAALVVVAVGEQDDGLAHRLLAARDIEQLVAAGSVYSVEQRRASTRAETVNAGLQSASISLVQSAVTVGVTSNPITKARSLLAFRIWSRNSDGRLLLKLKAGMNRGAGVDDNANAQGQIDLLVEGVDPFRRFLVVEQCEIVQLQVGNVMAVLVSHREDEIDLIHGRLQRGHAHIRSRRIWLSRGLLNGGGRRGLGSGSLRGRSCGLLGPECRHLDEQPRVQSLKPRTPNDGCPSLGW